MKALGTGLGSASVPELSRLAREVVAAAVAGTLDGELRRRFAEAVLEQLTPRPVRLARELVEAPDGPHANAKAIDLAELVASVVRQVEHERG